MYITNWTWLENIYRVSAEGKFYLFTCIKNGNKEIINWIELNWRLKAWLLQGVLTEGVKMEVYPSSPSIPPGHTQVMVKLMAKPLTAGQLKILGMSYVAL
jgi:hypothetical protein